MSMRRHRAVRGGRVSTRWRATRVLLIVTIALLTALPALPLGAQPATPAPAGCVAEREPNDNPGQEQDLGRGPVCVDARKTTASQDLYIWTVTPEEAVTRWSLDVSGVPGQATKLEVYHVEKDASGKVTKADKLLGVTSATGESVGFHDLFFPAGTYTIAFVASGPGPYRLTIQEGEKLQPVTEQEPDNDAATAQKVAGAFAASGDRSGDLDVFAWTINDGNASKRWTLRLQGPITTTPELRISRQDGTQLGDYTAGPDGVVALPDVGLSAGTYLLTVVASSDPSAPYLLMARAEPSPGPSDLEPNDSQQTATAITLAGAATVVRGRLATVTGASDADFYALPIDDQRANRQIYVKLFWRGGRQRTMCLLDAAGNELQCQTATTGIAFNALVLPKGIYAISIKGDPAPDDPYLLRVDVTREAVKTFEAEPNNSLKFANPIAQAGEGFTITGRLAQDDEDYFKITVAGAPQLWLLQADGTGVGQLDLMDVSDTAQMTARAGTGPVAIYDAFLLPGDHWLRISGDSGEYTLKATPLGPPDPEAELEPNNDVDHSQPIRLLETRSGRLVTAQDTDVYRFSLQNAGYTRLELAPPADGQTTISLDWQAQPVTRLSGGRGVPIVWDGWLEAGDYVIYLTAMTPSAKPYRLRVSPLDPFVTPADLEPNDDPAAARPFPASLAVSGLLDPQIQGGDRDNYLIPARPTSTQVTITATGAELSVALTTVGTRIQPGVSVSLTAGTVADTYLATLPANTPVVLQIGGQPGPYTVRITPGGQTGVATPIIVPPHAVASPLATPLASPQASPLAVAPTGPLAASLRLENKPVAAFWQDGQRISGTLTLTNTGPAAIDTTLDAATGAYAWSVEFGKLSVTIAPNASIAVPVTVHVAPDAWADAPVLITVRARGGGAQATASALVTPAQDAVPLAPERVAPLPPALLGGFDLAWTGLGAKPVAADENAAKEQAALYDQLTYVGAGWQTSFTGEPVELTVQLAAESPVAGIVLNPQAMDNAVTARPKDFELQLSLDGQQFTTVLTGTMSPRMVEQPFVLTQPVTARFARLRLLSTQSEQSTGIALGEWKVIATPGWTLPAANGLNGLDLSPPERGGHVVSMAPQFSDVTAFQSLTSVDAVRQTLEVSPDSPVTWVIGFHNDRAAKITSLVWLDPPGSDPRARFDRVQVEIAVDSPSGPWTSLGTWTLDRSAGAPVLALPKPEWARFVRFTGTSGVAPEGSAKIAWEFPETVRIIEAPPGGGYLSALGEWGNARQDAIYEALSPPAPVTLDPDAGNMSQTATVLPLGKTVTDSAAAGRDVDWYRVVIPAGDDLLRFTLQGHPTIEVAVTLIDASGQTIAVKTEGATATSARYSAPVTAGATYYLRVEEPPSSIVFAFDTSGSIGPYITTVYQGLYQYAGDVKPGQEFVNILPFGANLLLKQWSDQPYQLQAAITNYPRAESSSDSEGSLLRSMDGFASRPGAKAVVLITDGETFATPDELQKIWPQLDNLRPQVFSIQVAGQLAHSQDLMQDWAAVKDGQYVYVADQGQMDVAFARATTILRRPTIYSLTAEAATAPPTPTPSPTSTPSPTNTPVPTATPSPAPSPSPTPAMPGAIKVEAPPASAPPLGVPQDVSVGIILDTSGSMLQGLDGSTRIDVAKSALTDLVTQTIPAGTGVSLRTFGDTPDSCETRLVVPRGPLDPATMAQTIDDIPVVNLVKTPIGDSLREVAGDLGSGPGPKIVVLVTDGEETCGGDPAAAIQALVASGVDVRVNIVGFAVDDATLKAQFDQWARLGNGRYIDASSADELRTAVRAAVQPGFDVVAADGSVVASGQVGGNPVAVPAGTYGVVVHSDPVKRVDEIVVVAGQTTTVRLDGGSQGRASPGDARAGPKIA